MCTFLSSLPKKSKSNGVKKNTLPLYMKPCPIDKDGKKSWYRFRLLAWTSPEKNDRDDAFIERFVHQIWKKNEEKGYMYVDDEVTCPVTKHVHVDGNRYDLCPICKLANQYFISWKESAWKDRESAKKNKSIGRKYQAIIPVYVVEDPNYQGNKGKVKVLIFNDKKFYTEFRQKVEKASQLACVFNGKHAVDCCMQMSEVKTLVNEGEPNQYEFKTRVIDKITFTKAEKAYDIPSITKELVTNCGFDEEYYTSSTADELQAFYDRHYKISNDDIPEEDDIQVYEQPVDSIAKSNLNIVENTNFDNPLAKDPDDLDDVLPDSTDVNANEQQETDNKVDSSTSSDIDINDINSDDLLKDLGL